MMMVSSAKNKNNNKRKSRAITVENSVHNKKNVSASIHSANANANANNSKNTRRRCSPNLSEQAHAHEHHANTNDDNDSDNESQDLSSIMSVGEYENKYSFDLVLDRDRDQDQDQGDDYNGDYSNGDGDIAEQEGDVAIVNLNEFLTVHENKNNHENINNETAQDESPTTRTTTFQHEQQNEEEDNNKNKNKNKDNTDISSNKHLHDDHDAVSNKTSQTLEKKKKNKHHGMNPTYSCKKQKQLNGESSTTSSFSSVSSIDQSLLEMTREENKNKLKEKHHQGTLMGNNNNNNDKKHHKEKRSIGSSFSSVSSIPKNSSMSTTSNDPQNNKKQQKTDALSIASSTSSTSSTTSTTSVHKKKSSIYNISQQQQQQQQQEQRQILQLEKENALMDHGINPNYRKRLKGKSSITSSFSIFSSNSRNSSISSNTSKDLSILHNHHNHQPIGLGPSPMEEENQLKERKIQHEEEKEEEAEEIVYGTITNDDNNGFIASSSSSTSSSSSQSNGHFDQFKNEYEGTSDILMSMSMNSNTENDDNNNDAGGGNTYLQHNEVTTTTTSARQENEAQFDDSSDDDSILVILQQQKQQQKHEKAQTHMSTDKHHNTEESVSTSHSSQDSAISCSREKNPTSTAIAIATPSLCATATESRGSHRRTTSSIAPSCSSTGESDSTTSFFHFKKKNYSRYRSSSNADPKPNNKSSKERRTNANTNMDTTQNQIQYKVGMKIDILKDKYKNVRGAIIERVTHQSSSVSVKIPNLAGRVSVSKNHIRPSLTSNDLYPGLEVRIASGNRQGEMGKILYWIDEHELCVGIVQHDDESRYVQEVIKAQFLCPNHPINEDDDIEMKLSRNDDDQSDTLNTNVEGFRIRDCNHGGIKFGNQRIERIKLGDCEVKEKTFLQHFLGLRTLLVIKPFNDEQTKIPVECVLNFHGCRWELISTKVQLDESSGGSFMRFCPLKCLHMVYVQVTGPGMCSIRVQDCLDELVDFSTLSPRKMVARLELFQSPMWNMYKHIKASQYGLIEERGHEGCGFICEGFLEELLESKKGIIDNTINGKSVVCIQVRLFIPKLGGFKGELMRRQRDCSRPDIELPTSMRKMPPAPCANPSDGSVFVINKAGLDPSTNNRSVGKLTHILPVGGRNAPSFKPKKLSDMITRMFLGFGVPRKKVNRYQKNSTNAAHLEHAFLRGVCDPTNCLPPGHIFIPGLKQCPDYKAENIFVTRSPCLQFSDARMLPVVREKPRDMSPSTWNWLNNLSFGEIIFAFPKKGTKPLPVLIANGDLDGDRYFVCWNKDILEHIDALPPLEEAAPPEDEIPQAISDDNWLVKAQQQMTNSFADTHLMSRLISSLYKLCHKKAEEHGFDNNHPDVCALADAFNQGLDFGKHGGEINLPEHLHELVNKSLRHLLVSPPPEEEE